MHTRAIGGHTVTTSLVPSTRTRSRALPTAYFSLHTSTLTRSHGQVEEPHQPQPVEQEPPQWDQGSYAPASP
ncbi:hypothetical protein JIQ42_00372 [Leishmania sp. Namibia]|uniref:hypothetical protein n=1 Tax=Leishmania sp. Namibia TaxID=2802991 RepID=UPI001B3DDD7E|nr:hypothetical protein JIQ42_00372 [Leishmania sp. Namibia]